jgi:hypothetical protein
MLGANGHDLGVPELPRAGTGGLELAIHHDLVNAGLGAPARTAEDTQEDRRLVLLPFEVDVERPTSLGRRQQLEVPTISRLHGGAPRRAGYDRADRRWHPRTIAGRGRGATVERR